MSAMSTTNSTPTLLMTKKEAGRQLGVSERTVHDMIAKGMLPAVRFGGNVRILREDLLAFIQRQKAVANA